MGSARRPVGVPRKERLHRQGHLECRQQTVTGGRVAILLIGSNGLTLDPQGRLIITAMADRNIVRLEKDGKRTILADRYRWQTLQRSERYRSQIEWFCLLHG
jgi:sugar lactone lactonase YvrE